MRVLTLGGIAGAILFSAVIIVSAALRTDYSHIANFISELGATGTPHAALMNYAGFLPTGILLVVFGIAIARALPQRRFSMLAVMLVTLFGTGVAVSGVASCDAGCPIPGGSVENIIHNNVAPMAFLCLIAAAAILGVVFRGDSTWRSLSVFSLVSSLLGLVFLAALVGSLEARELTGLWQRLLLAVLFVWCSVIGLRAYRNLASHSPT